MKGLVAGRIVHYEIAGHEYPGAERAKGHHRPAIVVQVWGRPPGSPGYVNALLFLDGSNDGRAGTEPVWLTSIEEGEGLGKWHEPERVE